MIKIENPFEVLLADTEKSEADIRAGYGPAAYKALHDAQELQAAAFRQGARAQLDAACADLRTWAAAYAAKGSAISNGLEQSDDAHGDAKAAWFAAGELAQFAKDWASDEYGGKA